MIIASVIFLGLGLLLASITYYIDYHGDTKVYGAVVITLWLSVCLCLVLTVAFMVVGLVRLANGFGH
jgi:hypothetical protein